MSHHHPRPRMVATPAEYMAELQAMTRRQFLGNSAWGIGGVALAAMLGSEKSAHANTVSLPPAGSAIDPLMVRAPHFAARAKRVIFIHLAGAPSQHELFDWKPALVRRLRRRRNRRCN